MEFKAQGEALALDKTFDGNLLFQETEGEAINAVQGEDFSYHGMPKRRKFLLVSIFPVDYVLGL